MLENDLVVYPHTDWRGTIAAVSFDGGHSYWHGNAAETPPVPTDENRLQTAFGERNNNGRQVVTWLGSLLIGQVGENGLAYKRNRYYDPQSGRFTQEDPIGLAGGANLYGFAAGDPINSRDPFGLCPGISGTDPKNVDDCPDESKRGFWDRLWNGVRYVEAEGKREPITKVAFPSWIGGVGEGFESFGAFKRAMGSAGDGMQWHHIVEQAGNVEQFGAEAVHSAENLIAIPTELHEKVSAYYSSIRTFTGGQTVRMWLRGQSFEDQFRFGMDVLRNFGVIR